MNIELDLYKAALAPGPIVVKAGDCRAMTVEASVLDHGSAFPLDGKSVRFECVTDRDERAFAECSVEGSTATFAMPPFWREGRSIAAYLKISDGDATVTTNDMEVRVVR